MRRGKFRAYPTAIEALEQRIAPAVFLVTTTADSGVGSLRQAIIDANNATGFDTINFQITGSSGVQTIKPLTPLPTITEQLDIQGYSQSGASSNSLAIGNDAVLTVELDGSFLTGSQAIGLSVQASNVRIQGLVINHFEGSAISIIGGSSNIIRGNFLGTTANGLAQGGSFTSNEGIFVSNSTGTIIGGASPGDRNIISGFASFPIHITGASDNSSILGNYIGTTKDGNAMLPNGGEVYVAGNGAIIGNDTTKNVFATSGANVNGLHIVGTNAVVRGNYFGLGADGFTPLGISGNAIVVSGDGSAIGTNNTGNVIVNAGLAGIVIDGNNTTVLRNYIGTNPGAGAPLGNAGAGILVNGSNAVIGDVNGNANVITNSGLDGVKVAATATSVSIRGNTIYNNQGLGINLVGGTELVGGVTQNDVGDGDSGANGLQNYPLLTGISGNVVNGSFSGAPLSSFTIDFYVNNTPDPTGFGEGQTYLGSQVITTDASGNAVVTFNSSTALAGKFVSATASTAGAAASTSEFSNLAVGSQTFTWDGGGGADLSWLNPLNWDRDLGVPGMSDIAIIDTDVTVLLPTAVTVGTLSFSTGRITGPGDLVVLQTFDWNGGIMSGTGITRIDGGMVIGEGTVELSGRTLSISAGHSGIIQASGNLTISNGALFDNHGFVLAQDGASISYGGGALGRFSNATAFNVGAGASVDIGVPFDNDGGINAAGSVTFTAGFNQSITGTVVGGGLLTFQGGDVTANGFISADVINDGAVLHIGGKNQIGSLNISGSYEQQGDAVLEIEVGKTKTGPVLDNLTTNGPITLTGALEVSPIGGFIIPIGANYAALNYGSVVGQFTTVRAPAGLSAITGPTSLSLSGQAPAGTKVLTVTDEDGDIVTVRVNKGLIPNSAFTIGPNGELQVLDLRAVGGKLNGANVTISVQAMPGGNGFVDIGMINASGLNLGKLVLPGDLGQIEIGTGVGKAPALKSLTVNSLGARGTDNLIDGIANPLVSQVTGSVGKVNVLGDVQDTVFSVSGKLGKVTIQGDFLGSDGGGVGLLEAFMVDGKIVPRVSGGAPVGAFNANGIGQFTVNGDMNDSAVSANGNIGSVNVGGDLDRGAILSNAKIKTVKILGSMVSADPDEPSVVAALARPGSSKPANAVAIDVLKVKGDVENAQILLGYNKQQVGKNPDASAGKVIVEGNWTASSLVAGVLDVTSNGFGIDDATVPGDTTAKIVSKIASIVIKGTATGSAAPDDHFGITAQNIGKLSINGTNVPLDKKNPDNIQLDPVNMDFSVVEL